MAYDPQRDSDSDDGDTVIAPELMACMPLSDPEPPKRGAEKVERMFPDDLCMPQLMLELLR
jgi:hypothetical protein